MEKKPFWWKWKKKEATFTVEQVANLVEQIKEFNAGIIDAYLDKHVDKVFKLWVTDNTK